MISFVCLKTHVVTSGSASPATCVTLSLVGKARRNLYIPIRTRTDCLRLACRPLIAKMVMAISGWDFMTAAWPVIVMDAFDFSRKPMDYRRELSMIYISTMPDGCGPRLVLAESFVSTLRRRNTQA